MNIIKKIIYVVIGSVIAAFGIDLAIYAGFGGATLAVLWQGVSYVLHITLGQASFVVAVGTAIYSYADWGRGSYEAVTFALAKKHSWQIKYVRIALDAMVVLFGMFLGGKFGMCTICTILLSGVMIQKTLQLLHAMIENKA